jgi:Conserved TM helix
MTSPSVIAVEWSQGIEDAWSNVARFVPRFVAFLVVLIIGWIIAKAISRIADRLLERVEFDRAVQRGGIEQALARSDYDASDIVSRLIYLALMLIVLQVAFSTFGPNPFSEMIRSVIAYLPNVLVAILIIVVAAAIGGVVRDLVTGALGGLEYGRMIGTLASVAILTVGVFAALSQLRIAPAIINGLFFALLAVVVGSAIVAIGGGGIQPMRQRWERSLQRYDSEKPRVQQQMQESRRRREEQMVEGRGEYDMTRSEERRPTPPSSR